MSTFTNILITIVIFYITLQILNFYGIGRDIYGIYLTFFIFIAITSVIIKKDSLMLDLSFRSRIKEIKFLTNRRKFKINEFD